ncbi:hypothetical protein QTN25_002022 [Entamoeba marina]
MLEFEYQSLLKKNDCHSMVHELQNALYQEVKKYCVLDIQSGSDLYRKWKLYGDADLSVYSVPFRTSIKLSFSKKNMVNPKSFNIPINTIQDFALLFKIAYDDDSLVDEIAIMDKSYTFSHIFDRFGEDCEPKSIGLKDKQYFDKGMYIRNDGNTTYIIGTMYSSFYFINFQTS